MVNDFVQKSQNMTLIFLRKLFSPLYDEALICCFYVMNVCLSYTLCSVSFLYPFEVPIPF